MPISSQGTEITLGTGRMLALFFTFVLVCAVFFAIGFSLGRKTSIVSAGNVLNGAQAAPATVVRPSAGKDATSQPPPQTTDFSFYKSVGAKTANTDLKPAESQPQPVSADQSKTPIPVATAAPATGAYFVQVAAVSRQEDAEALVQALQKKQYPAFTANNTANDKFYHVQVGPYADMKDAEAMRTHLVADGYNPIVKK